MGNLLSLFKQTFSEWTDDKAPVYAAALAYYAVFSLAPLLLILIALLGIFYGSEEAQNTLMGQIEGVTSESTAQFIGEIVSNASSSGSNVLATMIGVATLLIGATGVFAQLQNALNQVWEVEPAPGGGIMHLLKVRLLSLGMVLAIGFLLLVSLLLTTALDALSGYASGVLPGADFLWQILSFVVQFGIITLLFAMIFKYLPDVTISWKDVWIGAAFTALLFVIGKYLISLYLTQGAVASSYGAAGSLVVILLWVFYSAQILFFGAEFTQVYGKRYGSRIVPAEHAVRQE